MSQAELQPNHEKLPGIIIATEPLNRYRPFLTNAQLYGPYAEAYVRWRTVESGGAKSLEDTTDTGEPTGWDGYLAGFKPDEQAEIKNKLGIQLAKSVRAAAKIVGMNADDIFHSMSAGLIMPNQARVLDRVFAGAKRQMQIVGNSGADILGYTEWRLKYEQDYWALQLKLENATNQADRKLVQGQIFQLEMELSRKLAKIEGGRLVASAKYNQVHERVANAVSEAMQRQSMQIDDRQDVLRYPLPSIVKKPSVIRTSGKEEIMILTGITPIGSPPVREKVERMNSDTQIGAIDWDSRYRYIMDL